MSAIASAIWVTPRRCSTWVPPRIGAALGTAEPGMSSIRSNSV
jgi:hypothetical protein